MRPKPCADRRCELRVLERIPALEHRTPDGPSAPRATQKLRELLRRERFQLDHQAIVLHASVESVTLSGASGSKVRADHVDLKCSAHAHHVVEREGIHDDAPTGFAVHYYRAAFDGQGYTRKIEIVPSTGCGVADFFTERPS